MSAFRTLGWRILFWMSVASLGPLLIMSYQGYHCARNALVEAKEMHFRSVLASRVARLSDWHREVSSDFRFMAVAPCTLGYCNRPWEDDGPTLAAACCNFLDNVSRRTAAYAAIASFSPEWKLVSHTQGETVISDAVLPARFKVELDRAGEFMVSPAVRELSGTIRVFVGHPIKKRNGDHLANLVAALDLTPMFRPVFGDRTGLGETGRVILLAGDGSSLIDDGHSSEELPRSLLESADGRVVEFERAAGTRVLAAAAPIPALDGRVVVQMDAAEVYASLGTLRNQAVITGLITFLVILLLSIHIAGRLSRPMRQLVAVSRKIAAGDPEERLSEMLNPEAAEVGAAFNKMLDELAASQHRLMQAASLAAVGRLSTSVVHEMRNPLSSIKLNLAALQRKVEDDPTHAELANLALDQAVRLETMLTDLLSYGKPLKLDPRPLRFAELAGDVTEDVRPALAAAEVTTEIEDRLGEARFLADAEQMRRALTNLLTNAVDAAPSGSTVTIRGEPAPDNAGRVRITVSDHGPGIPADNLSKLFQPFFTTRDEGTGLGLANVKKIVEAHGGGVAGENLSRGGAAFVITLPAGGTHA